MKKITIIYAFALLLAGSAILHSCQKHNEDKNLTNSKGSVVDERIQIADARTFFETEVQTNISTPSMGFRQGIKKAPRWNEAYITNLSDGALGVVVPLRYETNISLKSSVDPKHSYDLQNNSYLLITLSAARKSANVITTIPGEYLSSNKLNVSQYILEEDWAGNLVEKYAIIDHKIRKLNTVPNSKIKTNSVGNGCEQVNWYICTLNAETNTYYNCYYTHSEFINCDVPESEVGNEDQCILPDLTSGVTTANDLISQDLISINSYQKYNNPKWTCLVSDTWHLESQEYGKVSRVDPVSDIWWWDSLRHGSITLIGTVNGGSITHSDGVGTPNFVPGTPNVQAATMELTFNVTYTQIANCIPLYGRAVPPTTIGYTSHAGWNAKP